MTGEQRKSPLYPTVSQTVGPYFHIGLAWLFSDQVVDAGTPGEHVTVQGRVLDGDGAPVSDALIEVWQADADGKYAHPADPRGGTAPPGFKGYARVPTDEAGAFHFGTVKPGPVPAPAGGMQAPHIGVHVFMRGLLRPLATRIYFADEPANEEDLVLRCVSAARRATLIARRLPGDALSFEWNVVLQGAGETVFFDC
jgi:protocatechuate 3,4-dioxygenase, alpha subunit